MTRIQSVVTIGGLSVLTVLSAGCAAKVDVSANEFIARYTTNVAVPNPDTASLPSRAYLGEKNGLYRIKDVIPAGQGGGTFGKRIVWRCPIATMPRDFPAAYRPGDAIFDRRPDSTRTYMIQSYVPSTGELPATPPPATAPATGPATAPATAPAAAPVAGLTTSPAKD